MVYSIFCGWLWLGLLVLGQEYSSVTSRIMYNIRCNERLDKYGVTSCLWSGTNSMVGITMKCYKVDGVSKMVTTKYSGVLPWYMGITIKYGIMAMETWSSVRIYHKWKIMPNCQTR